MKNTDNYKRIEPYAKQDVRNLPKSMEEKHPVLSRALNFMKFVLVLALVIGIAILYKHFDINNANQKEEDKLSQLVEQTAVETTTEPIGKNGILLKYQEAYEKNNDLVGWITIPNTTIDHPVVQAEDNEYYLRKSFYGIYDKRGTVFMEHRCHADELCKNTILYGHNFLDSTMFSDLEKYKDLDFYKSAPIIEFNTIYKSYKWKVFAVYLVNVNPNDDNGYLLNYMYPFMTDENFEAYVEEIKTRTIINTTVDVDKTDKLLTLSTCTRDMDLPGHGETNARCIVLARLVRDGESIEVDTDSATLNENPKYPQIWYTANKKDNPFVNSPSSWVPEGVEY